MNILITSIIDIQESAPQRLHHFIRYLKKDHTITLLCIRDFWKKNLVDAGKYFKEGDFDGISIKYFSTSRVSPYLQEGLSPIFVKLPFEEKFDVLFNYNTLISGYYIGKKLRLPMVFDIADDLPEMIVNSPQIPFFLRSCGKYFGKIMLGKTIQYADKVTSTLETFKKQFNIPDEKHALLPNGVDIQKFRRYNTNLKRKLGLNENFILGYVGVIREWVDFTPVYAAMKNLPNVSLVIVGEEGSIEQERRNASLYGVNNRVFFVGTIPHDRVPEYISIMDACLIPFKQCGISQNALPIKLFEYMACERPVICSHTPNIQQLLGDMVLYADSAQQFIMHIEMLMNYDTTHQAINNRSYVEKFYNWEKISKKLENQLMEVAK